MTCSQRDPGLVENASGRTQASCRVGWESGGRGQKKGVEYELQAGRALSPVNLGSRLAGDRGSEGRFQWQGGRPALCEAL